MGVRLTMHQKEARHQCNTDAHQLLPSELLLQPSGNEAATGRMLAGSCTYKFHHWFRAAFARHWQSYVKKAKASRAVGNAWEQADAELSDRRPSNGALVMEMQ